MAVEQVADPQVGRVAVVQQRHPPRTHLEAEGGAVAALVAELDRAPGQARAGAALDLGPDPLGVQRLVVVGPAALVPDERGRDRKSTRLNSSHPSISYAVFCLKKKK